MPQSMGRVHVLECPPHFPHRHPRHSPWTLSQTQPVYSLGPPSLSILVPQPRSGMSLTISAAPILFKSVVMNLRRTISHQIGLQNCSKKITARPIKLHWCLKNNQIERALQKNT